MCVPSGLVWNPRSKGLHSPSCPSSYTCQGRVYLLSGLPTQTLPWGYVCWPLKRAVIGNWPQRRFSLWTNNRVSCYLQLSPVKVELIYDFNMHNLKEKILGTGTFSHELWNQPGLLGQQQQWQSCWRELAWGPVPVYDLKQPLWALVSPSVKWG